VVKNRPLNFDLASIEMQCKLPPHDCSYIRCSLHCTKLQYILSIVIVLSQYTRASLQLMVHGMLMKATGLSVTRTRNLMHMYTKSEVLCHLQSFGKLCVSKENTIYRKSTFIDL